MYGKYIIISYIAPPYLCMFGVFTALTAVDRPWCPLGSTDRRIRRLIASSLKIAVKIIIIIIIMNDYSVRNATGTAQALYKK